MSWKILKYTQAGGFEVIDDPFGWDEGGTTKELITQAGFDGCPEEREGCFDQDDECVEGIFHWYKGEAEDTRLTIVDGPSRSEYILTLNAADHIALRIALAPLAHVRLAVRLADAHREHGTLKKWWDYECQREESARQARQRREAGE